MSESGKKLRTQSEPFMPDHTWGKALADMRAERDTARAEAQQLRAELAAVKAYKLKYAPYFEVVDRAETAEAEAQQLQNALTEASAGWSNAEAENARLQIRLAQVVAALDDAEAAINGDRLCDHCGMDLGAAHHWGKRDEPGNHAFVMPTDALALLRGTEEK